MRFAMITEEIDGGSNSIQRLLFQVALATIGHRRVIAGTTAGRVIVLGEGTLDGISSSVYGSLRGTIDSATDTTITVVEAQPHIPIKPRRSEPDDHLGGGQGKDWHYRGQPV